MAAVDQDEIDRGSQALEQDIRRGVRRRLWGRAAFTWHAGMFAIVIAGLAMANMATNPGYLWFLWPACGWGIGLAIHAFATFAGPTVTPEEIELEVQRELRR